MSNLCLANRGERIADKMVTKLAEYDIHAKVRYNDLFECYSIINKETNEAIGTINDDNTPIEFYSILQRAINEEHSNKRTKEFMIKELDIILNDEDELNDNN